MITNTGQSILAKYLVGQAPAYASYIAIGCGATPVTSSYIFSEDETTAMKSKESLDFEMFRIPVTSRGYVTENGVSKIVFTGELPTLERYDITEVGLWSAGSNPSANFNDSRPIFLFSKDENWEYENSGLIAFEQKLDLNGNISVIPTGETEEVKAFITNADNPTFTNPIRSARYEGSRFLNSIIALRGDLSGIEIDSITEEFSLSDDLSPHLTLTGATLDFDKSSPKDELRLAFSVINKDSTRDVQPHDVRIILEFAQGDVYNSGQDPDNNSQYARFETVINSTDPGVDFENQRYFVSVTKFEELNRSSGFTWKAVDVVKVYATITEKNETTDEVFVSDEFYVCLDALRLENTQNLNPIYGLTGYSIVKNLNSKPITKIANSSNHIEFRFGLDVL